MCVRNRVDVFISLGACDMKGGVAVALSLAATVPDPVVQGTITGFGSIIDGIW